MISITEPVRPAPSRPPAAPSGEQPPAPLRVLMLEDDPAAAATLERLLNEAGIGITTRRCAAIDAYHREIVGFAPDLVVIDHAAAPADSIGAILFARQSGRILPVVVVSPPLEDEAAVALVRAGAAGYVRHDRIAGFAAAVREALREAADERRRHEVATVNASLARTDPLTGLANRLAFIDALRSAFATARRDERNERRNDARAEGRGFAVFYLDIDHFSEVNDRLGHATGDRILREVADRLRLGLRETDLVARLGGDEFAVLQSDVREPADTGVLAAKLRARIAEPFSVGTNILRMTMSVGIALYGGGVRAPAELLGQADEALYRAKGEGRDRYCFYSGELDAIVRERQLLSEELHAAVAGNELELHYQPQIALADNRIVGLEALVRWHHPRRGLLLPDAFLPISERNGTIRALGAWVLNEVCRQLAAWRAEGTPEVPVAINLSPAQFNAPIGLGSEVSAQLERWNLPPGLLELEMAETGLIEVARDHDSELRRIGLLHLRLVFDGFGMGQFAITHINGYGFARIKMARHLLDGAPADHATAAVLRAVVGLAHDLDLQVVATGVETASELAFVKAAGCPMAQGYHICTPLPARRIGALRMDGTIVPGVMGAGEISGPIQNA